MNGPPRNPEPQTSSPMPYATAARKAEGEPIPASAAVIRSLISWSAASRQAPDQVVLAAE
ncbi:hypothetical protein [Actinacidiphila glaucinigra]|uniref:hypothetical protein n=1 Tax=Actinacidiphila glaucinigra TaxID=235986 RepID=UPI00366FFBE5